MSLKPNPTQRESVVAYIESRGSITIKEAYALGITQLAARVFELKKLGYIFNDPSIKVIDGWGNEKTVTRYSIKAYPPVTNSEGQY